MILNNSLKFVGLDHAKRIQIANEISFNRLKHPTYGETIGSFTDNDGYNLTLVSVSENVWAVYYYAPDGTLISTYPFYTGQVW